MIIPMLASIVTDVSVVSMKSGGKLFNQTYDAINMKNEYTGTTRNVSLNSGEKVDCLGFFGL